MIVTALVEVDPTSDAIDAASEETEPPFGVATEGPIAVGDLCSLEPCIAEHYPLDSKDFIEVVLLENAMCGPRHLAVQTPRGWFRLPFPVAEIVCGNASETTTDEIDADMLGRFVLIPVSRTHLVFTSFDTFGRPAGDPTISYTEDTIACTLVDGLLRCISERTDWRAPHITDAGELALVGP
jgi:hypothetical protein